MAKELIVSKIIISLDVNGEFENGVVLYKVKEDGVIDKNQKSLGISNMGFSKLHLAKIIEKIIEKANEQEGVNG